MTISWVRPVFYLLMAAVLSDGCGGIIDPSKNTIREIPGLLQVGQVNIHDFTAAKNGEFEVKITRLTPNADVFLSLAYGPIQNGQCVTIYQQNQFAQLNKFGLAGPINTGPYCLIVSDIGTLTQPANYTLRVSHP
jgi:hypothetical protein